MSKQLPHQRSCQDVRMDPRYQKPPHYADIHQHRPVPQTPIEINEKGPYHSARRDTTPGTEGYTSCRCTTKNMNTQQTVSQPNLQITENGGI